MTLKDVAHALLSQPPVRRPLRVLTSNRRVPEPWRNLMMVKIANRVRFRDGEMFIYRTSDGQTLRFLNHDSANSLYWLGEYEPGSLDVFTPLCREARVVFDIGSNAGLYAVFAAAANPDAAVLAFEPAPPSVEICRRNLALNSPLTRQVELFPIALGDRDGEATFYMTGGTSSLNSEFRPYIDQVTVEVVRGDEIVRRREIARVDLIKIDTESTEPAVLRGFSATLARDRPDVLCEVLHGRTEADLEAIIGPLGYSRYWITAEGLRPRDHIVGDPTYHFPNYLFTVRLPADFSALGLTVLGS